MNFKLIVIVSIFLFGLYFCLNYKSSDIVENFTSKKFNCPNLLIKKGKELHLVNTKKATIPGVNPIRFNSLEEYADFSQWSQRVGLKCPILYFEQTYDAQNKRGYRMLNDPLNPKPGLPSGPTTAPTVLLRDANRDDPPYNKNNFAGFDPDNQYVGERTPLDNITLQTRKGSYSPVDSNWVGGNLTQRAVNDGDFDKRTRKILDKGSAAQINPPNKSSK